MIWNEQPTNAVEIISTQTFQRAVTASVDSCTEMKTKRVPISGVTSSGRVWRKTPESDTGSVVLIKTVLKRKTINPVTAPACKLSGLKSAQKHTCKHGIWWTCNNSTFNAVHFDRRPFTCSGEEGEKASMILNLALLLVVFRSGKHGSERVNIALRAY